MAFRAQALTSLDSGAVLLTVSSPLAWSSAAALSIPTDVKTTKVGLTGDGHEERTRWIHVAPEGEWRGHASGKFKLTPSHFRSVKTILDGKQTPCSLDYEHASIHPTGGPTPAAGFVQATDIRRTGLWALVEFTTEAWRLIKDGAYRFCSGVFDFTSTDPVTDEPLLCTLDTIALTNRPFIDGQHPIALSRAFARSVPLTTGAKMKITRKAFDKLLDGLGLKEFTPSQLEKLVAFLSADEDSTPEAIEVDDSADAAAASKGSKDDADKAAATIPLTVAPAAAASVAAPAVATTKDADAAAASAGASEAALTDLPMEDPVVEAVDDGVAKLMEATGLDKAGLDSAILSHLDAIVALLTGAEVAASVGLSRDLAVKALQAQVIAQAKDLNGYRTSEKASLSKALDAEVDTLVKTGRLHPGGRAEMVALARKSPAEFRALTKVLQPSLPVEAHATSVEPPPSGTESAEVKLAADHPKVVELTRTLDAMKVSGVHRANALKALTG